jgi:hypothetical protein
VVIYEGEKVMGRFERTRVQHWGLELAEEGSRLGARRDR